MQVNKKEKKKTKEKKRRERKERNFSLMEISLDAVETFPAIAELLRYEKVCRTHIVFFICSSGSYKIIY